MTALRGNPRSMETARDLCVVMQNVSLAHAQATVDADITAETGQPTNSTFVARTASVPAYYAGASAGHAFLLMEGCSFLSHGIMTVQGYQGAVGDSLLRPRNAYYEQLAAQALDAARAVWPEFPARVTLVGHSLGGAAMTVVARLLCRSGIGNRLDLCTFGAPKPMNTDDNAELSRCNVARWFNDDDPVPLVMPTPEDNLALLAIYSIKEVARYGAFIQPAGGLELFGQGRTVPGVLPSTASITPVNSLAAWLYSLDGSSHTPHDLDAYEYRYNNWLAEHPIQAQTAQRVGPIETVRIETNAVRNVQQKAVVNALRDQEQAQRVAKLSVPRERLIRVFRQKRLWYVASGESILTVSVNRRTALRYARRLRDALESIQTAGLTNREQLTAWLTSYLSAATQDNSGFVPTLKDQIAGV